MVYGLIAVASCGEPFGAGDETTATGAGTTTPPGTSTGGTTPTAGGTGGATGTGGPTTTGSGTGGAGAATSTGVGGGGTTTGTTTGPGGNSTGTFCDERFDMLTEYLLCSDVGNFCEFEVKLYGQDCTYTCNHAGVDCEDGFAPTAQGICDTSGIQRGCNHPSTTNNIICTCLKTCAANVACGPGQTCTDSGCVTSN
jgi:hypothetical protein